jgi:hypothetical protein
MMLSECVGTSSCDVGGSCARHSECIDITHCGSSLEPRESEPESLLDLEGLKAELRRRRAHATLS